MVGKETRLLLTTVFKPYGVEDGYAAGPGMQMELFNNQITRGQRVHSPRANFWTFPLYFLAENVSVPCTVLDFPSWTDFISELKHGYTHVGLSFIQTNVMKVKRMAEYVRRHHPGTKIILGGYGTSLPDLAALVPHDDVCHGEGIQWLRAYFGEDPARPVKHPIMHGVSQKHLYGVPGITDDSAVIFPGLGCENGCFFCSTSSKFNHCYIPLLPTGRSVFDVCREAETRLGVREFAVIDENFLKQPDRARDLLAEMERQGKSYNFWVFSSAEILTKMGVDFLVRLGVCAVWIGIETAHDVFGKMKDVDARGLIRELQDRGISVISSSILFMEHHDRASLQADIDWAIAFETDMHQFMQLTPLPGTPLFRQYLAEGRLIADFPYAKMSGQNVLNFHHPHFRPEEAYDITRQAFRKKYETHGPAVIKMAWTALHGYSRARKDFEARMAQGLAWNPETLRYDRSAGRQSDDFMVLRLRMMRRRAEEFRPLLTAAWLFSPNTVARRKCRELELSYREIFGPRGLVDVFKSSLLVLFGMVESLRLGWGRMRGQDELIRQPPTRRIADRNSGHAATP